MWIIIKKSDDTVVGTHYGNRPAGWNETLFDLKEWTGEEPPIHDPDEGVISLDPTIDNPDWTDFQASRVDFAAMALQADNQIAWLDVEIPNVPLADLSTLREYLERVMRQNRQMIKAWCYMIKRIAPGNNF